MEIKGGITNIGENGGSIWLVKLPDWMCKKCYGSGLEAYAESEIGKTTWRIHVICSRCNGTGQEGGKG